MASFLAAHVAFHRGLWYPQQQQQQQQQQQLPDIQQQHMDGQHAVLMNFGGEVHFEEAQMPAAGHLEQLIEQLSLRVAELTIRANGRSV